MIKSILDLCKSLNNPNVSYVSQNNSLIYTDDDYKITVDSNAVMTFHHNGYEYIYTAKSLDVCQNIIIWLVKGEITADFTNKGCLKLVNLERMTKKYADKSVGIVGKIIGTLISGVMLTYSLVVSYLAITFIFYYDLGKPDDIYSMVVLCAMIICGLGILKYIYSKKRVKAGWIFLRVFGFLLTTFFIVLSVGILLTFDEEPKISLFGAFTLCGCFALFVFIGIYLIILSINPSFLKEKDRYVSRLIKYPPIETAKALCEKINARNPNHMYSLRIEKTDDFLSIFESKAGGLFYWDSTMNSLHVDEGMFAVPFLQLDLRSFKTDTLPQKGILQFYLLTTQEDFLECRIERCIVVYHENVDYSITRQQAAEFFANSSCIDEYGIRAENVSLAYLPGDEEADAKLHESAEEMGVFLDEDISYSSLYIYAYGQSRALYFMRERSLDNEENSQNVYELLNIRGSILSENLYFYDAKNTKYYISSEYDDYVLHVKIAEENLKNLKLDKAFTDWRMIV
ncbi:MAG: DUF1963 domain-containing protein [Ruminococcus sp.]|nr:DUF1963 domain-containing protein [Ruminococcus sp.]